MQIYQLALKNNLTKHLLKIRHFRISSEEKITQSQKNTHKWKARTSKTYRERRQNNT